MNVQVKDTCIDFCSLLSLMIFSESMRFLGTDCKRFVPLSSILNTKCERGIKMSKKIAICSTGSSPSSKVDERFGRCCCFMIWEPETREYTPLSNTGTESAHGAGTGAVQSLIEKNVGVVLSQRVGPKAFAVLNQAGIKIFSGITGKTVEDALQSYEAGELKELLTPSN